MSRLHGLETSLTVNGWSAASGCSMVLWSFRLRADCFLPWQGMTNGFGRFSEIIWYCLRKASGYPTTNLKRTIWTRPENDGSGFQKRPCTGPAVENRDDSGIIFSLEVAAAGKLRNAAGYAFPAFCFCPVDVSFPRRAGTDAVCYACDFRKGADQRL